MLKPVRSIFCLGTRGPVWNAGFSKENRSNHITEERKLEVAFGMEKMSIHRNPVAGYSFHRMKKFTLIPCFFFLSRMPEENYVKKRPNNQKNSLENMVNCFRNCPMVLRHARRPSRLRRSAELRSTCCSSLQAGAAVAYTPPLGFVHSFSDFV
jgi:hypothetical protein